MQGKRIRVKKRRRQNTRGITFWGKRNEKNGEIKWVFQNLGIKRGEDAIKSTKVGYRKRPRRLGPKRIKDKNQFLVLGDRGKH